MGFGVVSDIGGLEGGVRGPPLLVRLSRVGFGVLTDPQGCQG